MDRYDLINRILDVDPEYVDDDIYIWPTEDLQELALNLGIEIIDTED